MACALAWMKIQGHTLKHEGKHPQEPSRLALMVFLLVAGARRRSKPRWFGCSRQQFVRTYETSARCRQNPRARLAQCGRQGKAEYSQTLRDRCAGTGRGFLPASWGPQHRPRWAGRAGGGATGLCLSVSARVRPRRRPRPAWVLARSDRWTLSTPNCADRNGTTGR
ncbi:hypothetical protein GGS24DRAFT_31640 [Hypoxylon argillaceum]|nr:hypothetical protein GGS24DRAFT_31640 [Hypoxylon argillaceum]